MTDHAIAWQAQSLLLDYPCPQLSGHLSLLREVTATLSGPVGAPLSRFLDHLATTSLERLAADYVATFDHHKRFTLYLTYFTHGDTRERGTALLRFTHAYLA